MKKRSLRVEWRDWVAKRGLVRRAVILAPGQQAVCVRLPLERDGQTMASSLVKLAAHVILAFWMSGVLQTLLRPSHWVTTTG